MVPAVNQVELHPYFTQPDVRDADAAHGVITQSWSRLRAGGLGRRRLSHGIFPTTSLGTLTNTVSPGRRTRRVQWEVVSRVTTTVALDEDVPAPALPPRLLPISKGRARLVARLTEGSPAQGQPARSSCAQDPCGSRRARRAARRGTRVGASAVGLYRGNSRPRRAAAAAARRRTRADVAGRRRLAARRHGGDADPDAARDHRAAREDAVLNQPVRVDDRDRPLHAAQREALAHGDMRRRWTAAGMLVAVPTHHRLPRRRQARHRHRGSHHPRRPHQTPIVRRSPSPLPSDRQPARTAVEAPRRFGHPRGADWCWFPPPQATVRAVLPHTARRRRFTRCTIRVLVSTRRSPSR